MQNLCTPEAITIRLTFGLAFTPRSFIYFLNLKSFPTLPVPSVQMNSFKNEAVSYYFLKSNIKSNNFLIIYLFSKL